MQISEEQNIIADKLARKLEKEQGHLSQDFRLIKYNFGSDFLYLKTLALTLDIYVIASEPLSDLIMIERHYFKNRLISQFEFKFPRCEVKHRTQVEVVYDLPALSEEEMREIVKSPWSMTSDSFFFSNGVLLIHNKAMYNYAMSHD